MKIGSTSKLLERRFGGKWKYKVHSGIWECDDNNRYVCRVLTGKDFEGEYDGTFSLCLYYINGSKSPEWI